MGRWVLHVDLDQFIAAVEVLRRPELRGLPVVVGGDGDPTKRGVVSTASYEARAFGVRSGMPLRTAARRIPGAVFLAVDKDAYEAASAEVMGVLRGTGAVVEVLGWDEAFLGVVTDDPEAYARDVQRQVVEATALECSVGIGKNKLQAKVATDFGKPAGVYRLTGETWFECSVTGRPMPSGASAGARRPSSRRRGSGRSVSWRTPTPRGSRPFSARPSDRGLFASVVGSTTARCTAASTSPVRAAARSPSSRTSRTGTTSAARPPGCSRQVAADVLGDGRAVVRVVVKIRLSTFLTRTHGRTLPAPVSDADAIEAAALQAFGSFEPRGRVRLIGVRAEFA